MGASELAVIQLDESVRARLDECKRVRVRAADDSTGYEDVLMECDALESKYVTKES